MKTSKISKEKDEPPATEVTSNNICICLLGGLPGAGKTTFVDALKTISRENKSIGAPVIYYISFDEVYNLNDQDVFNANIWRASRQKVVEKVKYLIHLFKSSSSNNNSNNNNSNDEPSIDMPDDVESFVLPSISFSSFAPSVKHIILLDDNFYYKSMRHIFYKMAQEEQFYFGQLFLKTSLETCLIRNQKRIGHGNVPEHVIKRMNEIFEWPQNDNYYYEIDTTLKQIDDNIFVTETFETLLNLIIKAGIVPRKIELTAEEIARRESDRLLTLKNQIHLMDNLCKKLIGQVIKSAMEIELKEFNNNSSRQQQIKKVAQKELVTRTKNGKKILLKEIRQQSSSESSESIESISEYVHVTIQNIYKKWKIYLLALQLNHDLQINVIDQSNATNSTVTATTTNNKTTTINMNSVEQMLSSIKKMSFEIEEFRGEAASSGLGITLGKTLIYFSSIFIQSKSFTSGIAEIDALRILKLIFICYRNICANQPSSQYIAEKSGALLNALEFVLVMMRTREKDFAKDAGEDWRAMGINTVSAALQFIGNSIAMCERNQTIVWEFCMAKNCFSEMIIVGARMGRKIYGVIIMIIYNCLCNCSNNENTNYSKSHKNRLEYILLVSTNDDKSKHNTILSSILTHAISEQKDDPGFVWVEIMFETILKVGMFHKALNVVKPSKESPVQISMEQRILVSFLSRSCGVDTAGAAVVPPNEHDLSTHHDDYETKELVNTQMFQKITIKDVNSLINMLDNLILPDDNHDNDVGKNDNNKNEVRQEDKKMEVWESFLIDTITVVMSIFADLIVLGTDAVKDTIALNSTLLKFVMLCLGNPRKIGIAVQIMNVPNPTFPISPVLLLRVLANLFAISMRARDEIREMGAIPIVLSLAHLDVKHPLLREWGIMAIRNLCANNEKNQEYIQGLKVEKR